MIWTRLSPGTRSTIKFAAYILMAFGINWIGRQMGVKDDLLGFVMAGLLKGLMTEWTTRKKD